MVKFIKFALIGGAATLLQFFILGLLVEYAGLNPVMASALSYAISAIFNYLANYYFTFAASANHKRTPHKHTLPKFVVATGIGITFGTAIFAAFLFLLENYILTHSSIVQSSYLIAQLFATLATLILNFALHKFWIYKK